MELAFGPWLRKRRRVLDLTQEDLSQRAFCSFNTIRKLESGALMPSKALAQELARALELPPETHPAFVLFARKRDATASENAFSQPTLDVSRGSRDVSRGSQDVPRGSQDVPTERLYGVRKFHPPAPLTAAIGRERDTHVVVKLLRLPSARLVTLTGSPGTGKTRLALEVASELQNEYAHGAAFVPLAPLTQAASVPAAVAGVLGVRETANSPLAVTLREFLSDKQLLLILDNFEHLLDAAPLVNEWLTAAPGLKILTTSRESLRVYGERELPVAALPVPPLAPLPPLNQLEAFAAVQLFVERAQAVKPQFELTAQNAQAVARLCVGLDGLPLAIELAAARISGHSPQTLLSLWNQRLDVFKSGLRDRDARHQTLRGAIDWSYTQLPEMHQRALAHLGVFRGGFTQAAADAVCGFSSSAVLQDLASKSLVKFDYVGQDGARFTLLEMIREYALEKLEASHQAERASERHLDFFTVLAQRLDPEDMGRPAASELASLDLEDENMRQALAWALASGRNEKALALAAGLANYWYERHIIGEALFWLKQVLSANLPIPAELVPARARTRSIYADLLRQTGDFTQARPLLQETIADWRSVGEAGKRSLGFALVLLSRLTLWQGDIRVAHDSAQEGLELFVQVGDVHGQASALRRLGEWALSQQDYILARECLDRAIVLQSPTDNHFGHAVSLLERGDIARAQEDYDAAERDYRAAQHVNAIAQDEMLSLRLPHRLGLIVALQGDPERGYGMLLEIVKLSQQKGIGSVFPLLFAALAHCEALRQHPTQAMHWLGMMDNALCTHNLVLIGPEALEYAKTVKRVSQQAGEDLIAEWRAQGREMTLEQMLSA